MVPDIEFGDHPDETKIPQFVYKYRNWSNAKHKRIITEQKVYFAPPKGFDDPLDCKIIPRWDLMTEEDLFKKYMFHSREMHPSWSRQQHRSWAREMLKTKPLEDKGRIKEWEKKYFDDFNERFGVFSVTAIPSNIKMWEDYASYHTGFCIGFVSKIMFNDTEHFGGGGNCEYYDTLPVIHPNDTYENQRFIQAFSKEKKWCYEKEYRLHKMWDDPASDDMRTAIVPKDAFYEVIFGAKMEDKQKDEIKEAVKQSGLPVKFRNAFLKDGGRRVEIE